jgi:hypothetical protein
MKYWHEFLYVNVSRYDSGAKHKRLYLENEIIEICNGVDYVKK